MITSLILSLTIVLTMVFQVHAQQRSSLMNEDASICNPRLVSTSQTNTVLTNLMASTSNPDCDTGDHIILLTPGTWTISGNLTIADRFAVLVPQGAIFSISSGVTLTLNCSQILAGDYQIFTGNGNVACSQMATHGLSTLWFGAIPDDATDDAPRIQRAIDAACGTTGGVVYLGDGAYHLNTELTLCPGLHLMGSGTDHTIVNVVGAINGLRYAPGSLTEARIIIEQFRLIGTDASSLDLISFVNAANLTIRNMHIRNTSDDCIQLDNTHTVAIMTSRIEDCTLYGVHITNNAQPGIIHGVDFNANTVGTAHLYIAAGWWNIVGNNFEGANTAVSAVILAGATNISFENNFIELYTGAAILTNTVGPSSNISFMRNHVNADESNLFDFTAGSLAHSGIVIEHNRFAANIVNGTPFTEGGTVSFRYCNNNVENAVTAHVEGYAASLDCIDVRTGQTRLIAGGRNFDDNAGTFRFDGQIHLGTDANYNIVRNANQLDITAGTTGHDIDMRPGANDTIRFDAAGGITFDTASTFTSATLPTMPNGTMVYCSDCSPTSATCTGSSTGAIAKRLNSGWDCR